MLIPGFVTMFKDNDNSIHLYFYPGIDNFNQYYYNALDLSDCKLKYTQINNSDNSSEFIFKNISSLKVNCKLISKYNDVEYKVLSI